MIHHFAFIIIAFSVAIGSVSAKAWLTYEKCELVDEKYFDGDSFSVKAHTGYTYVFRLYGVDCPETDKRIKARIVEQAKEFKVKEREVIRWGKKAANFTKKFLRKPFTVYTQKAEAGGASKKNRYYAIIVDSEGKRLDEALLEAGLARAHGMGAEWDEPFWGKTKVDLPRKVDYDRFMTKLRFIENKAKRDKKGIWKR
ncbi:MAG: thermonuclease family protein [Akkermansiaceae bacterium]